MDDHTLRRKFETAEVTEDEWKHEEHIRIAYLYLKEEGFDGAYQKLKHHLEKLNRAHQVPDAPDRGYHETLTLAWLKLVQSEMDGNESDSVEFLKAHPHLLSKYALRFFYSVDRLKSPQAKREYLEPDRRPLP